MTGTDLMPSLVGGDAELRARAETRQVRRVRRVNRRFRGVICLYSSVKYRNARSSSIILPRYPLYDFVIYCLYDNNDPHNNPYISY